MLCSSVPKRISLLPLGVSLCLVRPMLSGEIAEKRGKMSLDELRTMRKQLAQRKRRIIANNDGCDALYFPRNQKATADGFLALRTKDLADTQVDTIAYCTISSGFSNFTHRTKVGSVLAGDPTGSAYAKVRRNVTQDLIDQGTDPLQAVVEFAHQHKMEVFWSMRMLKYDRPEWLVGDHLKGTRHGRWSSVDYALPEIRDLALGFIEEVCRNYDVEGVELDFFRHLCYFKSVASGGKATPEELDMMTGLMSRVRKMTEEVGVERGRPFLIAIRVPDSIGFCKDMGFDIERWLKDGLVDLLITTCYFRLNPWEYSVELGHKYGVPVYPCLSDSRVRGEIRFRRSSNEGYRGRAMNAWAAGADGIHTFNHFRPTSDVFRQVGDPETLAPMNKLYFVTVRDGNPNGWLANGAQYRNVPVLTPGHARSVTASKPLSLETVVGEDVVAMQKGGYVPDVKCHFEMPRVRRAEQLSAKLNGNLLTSPTLTEGWVDYSVRSDWIKRGANQIEIALRGNALPSSDEWHLVYDGSQTPAKPWRRDSGSERTEEKLVDGALFIADRGDVSGDYHYYRYPWGMDATGETVVEARAKVVSGSSFVIVSNGASSERLGLWPDHIDLWHNRKLRYEMDTTQDFHVYRIEINGQDLKVYVDDELRIDATGRFTPKARYRNEIAFGAANSSMVGEAYWDYVKARLGNQTCKDIVVSVSYEKK